MTDCTNSQLYAKWDETPTPISTIVFNNHKYELFDYHMSWTDAKAFCEARGGHLVTITDAAEQAEVLALANTGSFCTYYIGCSDAETEGTWKWVTGELFDYQNWDTDAPEPSHGDGENYGHLLTVNYGPNKQVGDWNDIENSTKYGFYGYLNGGFICEYDTVCEHDYVPVVTAPTCTEQGYTTYTCSKCGDSYVDNYVPALEHDYQAVVTNATCTEQGYTTHTCSRCGDSYVDTYVDALGHDLIHHAAQAPTCTAVGWDAYDTCSRCDYTTYVEMAALGHNFVNGVCTRCGAVDPDYIQTDAKIIVSEGRGTPGSTVTVEVSLEKNPGIVSAYLDLNYDATKLTLTNVEDTGLLKGGLFGDDYAAVPFALNWDDSLASANNPANGVIARLTFQIKESCPEGIVPITLHFEAGNIIDKDLNNVPFQTVSGAVEVVNYILGDVDGDGQVLAKDVATLRRYLARWAGVTIVEAAADVSKDGNITAGDVAILRRYLAHWTGVDLSVAPAPQTQTRSIPHRGPNTPTIAVSSVEGNVGDQITLDVDLQNNPGIVSAYLDLSYDNTKLKLVSVEDTKLLNGALFSNDYATIPFALNWDDSIASENNTKNGTIAKLTFEILDGCKDGSATVSISYVDGNILNYDLDNVDFAVEDGTVSVHVHQYAAVVTAPTCTEQGYTTYTCTCGDSYVDDYVDALGHDYVASVTAPTCTEGGYTTYTCSRCKDIYTADETAALGHDYVPAVTKPTCTEAGYTTYTCSRCKDTYTADETAALGHNYVDGVCTVCGAKDPDYKPDDPQPIENPFEDVADDDWFAAAVLWATSQNPPITNGTDATHFSPSNKCTRAEIVQFLWNAAGKPAVEAADNPFEDVKASDWYYNAVMWAVSNKITNGTDATHFSPTKKCTRAEVVMFLWNAAGKPENAEGTNNPFDDVPADAWYLDAVLWAVERGITSGTTPTTFAPAKVCTRAEVVQFLYKAA